MVKKLICLIWGHKTVHKAYTGETLPVTGKLGNAYKVALYRYERTSYCTRCGK